MPRPQKNNLDTGKHYCKYCKGLLYVPGEMQQGYHTSCQLNIDAYDTVKVCIECGLGKFKEFFPGPFYGVFY